LFDQPAENPDELAHLRRISGSNAGNEANFTWDLEPASASPFRIYFGAAVVAIVLAVVYFVWHGSQNPKHQQQVPPPSFAADTEPAPPSTTAASPATPTAATAAPTQPATAPPPSKASDTTDGQPHPNSKAEQPSEDKPIASGSQPSPLGNVALGNGSDELATAQRYLSTTGGVQRNSAEAAQWLWKSVAKHNSEATLLLADLYLRGDGVSKNCDQARVLLDAAARKGISRAGERLRNLQAFGCQ
jgi:TPR repeat protein